MRKNHDSPTEDDDSPPCSLKIKDIISYVFQAAKDLGVTLLTITHRPTLAKFHTHLLQFDGQGGWTFNSFSSEVFSTLGEERTRLEEQLTQVSKYKTLGVQILHNQISGKRGSPNQMDPPNLRLWQKLVYLI